MPYGSIWSNRFAEQLHDRKLVGLGFCEEFNCLTSLGANANRIVTIYETLRVQGDFWQTDLRCWQLAAVVFSTAVCPYASLHQGIKKSKPAYGSRLQVSLQKLNYTDIAHVLSSRCATWCARTCNHVSPKFRLRISGLSASIISKQLIESGWTSLNGNCNFLSPKPV